MTVSMLMLRILLDACRRRGVEVEQLLAGSGVEPGQLGDGSARIDSELFEGIARRALALTRRPALGLELGSRLPPQALSVVGYLLASAPTLRRAYADFERYAVLLADAPVWALREERQHAHFVFRCLVPQLTTQRLANDWALALAARIVAVYAPDSKREQTRAAFSHEAPSDLRPYRARFGPTLRFDQPETVLTFPRAWLDLPQAHGDESTCVALSELAERMLAEVDDRWNLSDRVRRLLRQGPALSQVSVAQLARQSGLSESALRRRLAAEGVSPSQLIDEARRRVACAELSRRDRSVKELASQLGYAELSSFHRAFKRWTGQTPAGYREACGLQGHAP